MTFTTCGECLYWYKFPGAPDGECRRHAPRATPVTPSELEVEENQPGGYHSFNWFPETSADDWCGEGRHLLPVVTYSHEADL